VRADWDAAAKQHRSLRGLWQSVGWRQLLAPLANQAIARLSFTSFCFTGIQLCFVAFLVVQLTNDRQLELVTAARFLALYQIAGVVSRPIWGWLADRLLSARIILIGQGLVITFATLAAGFINPDWPLSAITVLCIAAGISAAGYTGIAYGEYARLGGARGTEATALGSAAMFAGVLVLPAVFSLITAATGDYLIAYSGLAALAFISALSLALSKPS
jgi:nitrate/nitrite transporter NarK